MSDIFPVVTTILLLACTLPVVLAANAHVRQAKKLADDAKARREKGGKQ